MREITVSSAFVEMVLAGAEQQGINCSEILSTNNVSRLALANMETRVPLESFAAITREVMRVLDDEFLGLAARPQPLGSFAMMCRACIGATTIKRSIKRTAHYWNLFANTYRHEVLISGGRVFYEIALIGKSRPLNDYCVVALLSSIHRFHCWLSGQFVPLISVSMNFSEPDYSSEYRSLFYGAEIKYGQPVCQIAFDTRYATQDIVQTADTLESYLHGTNLSLLYQPRHYRAISDQVRRWLEKNIRRGNYQATLIQAAGHFQMSPQVLHRRLQAEDTSFKQLKMQTRRDTAINLLFSDQNKIEEIATMVGFSEPSAFIRAFKKWTGMTPLSYRQENR